MPQNGDFPLSVPVHIGSSLPTGAHLAVIWWHQRSGELDEYLQIAYDLALANQVDDVSLPFADIAVPYSENLICFRACRDRARCDCNGQPQIAMGNAVLSIDLDQDGRLSLDEVRREQFGVADVVIGWAPMAMNGVPPGFNGTFAVLPIPAGASAFAPDESNLLKAVPTARTFDMRLCPPANASCAIPNVAKFCHRNCDRDFGLNRLGL